MSENAYIQVKYKLLKIVPKFSAWANALSYYIEIYCVLLALSTFRFGISLFMLSSFKIRYWIHFGVNCCWIQNVGCSTTHHQQVVLSTKQQHRSPLLCKHPWHHGEDGGSCSVTEVMTHIQAEWNKEVALVQKIKIKIKDFLPCDIMLHL